jgi:hypothetical protein
MNNFFKTKYIFGLIFSVLFIFYLLNFFVKIPNDGVLYLSSAEYFLKHGAFIDITRSFGSDYINPIPTPQIGIILYLIALKSIFNFFWVFVYFIILAILWTVIIKKLFYFSEKNFGKIGYGIYFFPFLIFFNYDYLVSASAFYNEALYFPFLIFSFLKVINAIQKKKSIFKNSYLFIFFLLIGVIFRIQHLVFLGTLTIFVLLYNSKKDFIYLCFLTVINIVIFFWLIYFVKQYEFVPNPTVDIDKDFLDYVYNLYHNQISQIGSLIFKNLKVNLSLYVNYLNLPKILDFHLVNNFTTPMEVLYLVLALIGILSIVLYFKKKNDHQVGVFLLLYLILSSVFLFIITDYTSRYFLLTNFCVLFFLFNYLKKIIIKINRVHIVLLFVAFSSVFAVYANSYFKSTGQYSKSFVLRNLLSDFNYNRNEFYDDNDLMISKHRYNIFWMTGLPAIRKENLIDSNLMNNKRRYFFVGDINELNNYPELSNNIIDIKDYSYLSTKNDKKFSIWRVYFDKVKQD